MSSNLLVVDEKKLFDVKQFGNVVNVDHIEVTDNFEEAIDKLCYKINGQCPYSVLVISTVWLDKKLKEKQLADLAEFYQGAIIVKADSDLIGLDLIKRGLCTDYYLSSGDQCENMKKAVNTASIHKRCLEKITEMNRKIEALKVLEKAIKIKA